MAVEKNMDLQIELEPSVTPEVTPSEPVAEVVPEKEEEVVTPEVETKPAEETLYELPDGRKVDAATLSKEWKENFLPEFTRRSQENAALRPKKEEVETLPEWARDGYVPKSYAEIIKIAKEEALQDIARTAEAEEKQRAEIVAKVDQDIAALKSKDPKLDENALFAHANKYGFRDLNAAYENYKAFGSVALATEKRILGGQKKTEVVSSGGAGSGISAGDVGYGSIGHYSGAQEFLSRVKGGKN